MPDAAIREAPPEQRLRQLQAVFESIGDPFSVMDRDLRLTLVNRAAAEMIGSTPEALLGKAPGELLENAESLTFVQAYRRVLSTHRAEVVEDYVAPLDRWFEATIYPLDDGLCVYSRDVTARRRNDALIARLARHESVRADVTAALATHADIRLMLQRCAESLVDRLNVSFARIWTTDEAGTTLLLQSSAGKYTHIDGPHRAVPVGQFKIGLIAEEKRPHLTNDVAHDPRVGNPEWARSEGMVAFAGYPLMVDGAVVGVMAMFATEPLPQDTLYALGGVADAIAQGIVRRRAEIELEARATDLERSNADLEQFAYVASHDLQEPLRMVASYNQLLARRYKGKLDSDADEFIAFTVEGVARMQRLINDLLAYSRVGRRGKDFVEVDLEKVLAAARWNLESAIGESHAEITADALPTVSGDLAQLTQVFQNLIANAIKFHGEAPPRVHIGCRAEGSEIVLSFRDNGIGVDPQYFDRIFVIFQRLHPRETYPGTGIGLAICKKIVQRHGGRIWMESEPGKGATISFTLPTVVEVRPSRRSS